MSFVSEHLKSSLNEANDTVPVSSQQEREDDRTYLELQVISSTLKSIRLTLLFILSSVAFLIGRVLA